MMVYSSRRCRSQAISKQARKGSPMTRHRIDVHGHYVGDVLLRWIKHLGYRPKGGYKISPWTVEGAIAFMDRPDIAAQVLSVPMAFTGTEADPDFPARLSREIN